ncbi:MAG: hypothetical protein MUC91_07640, partial [Verrucomicrobia bacterium]|nr:hypothetical protein [Verrucomicrobiota bacterium]
MQNRVIMRQAAVFMAIGLGILQSSAQTTYVPEGAEFSIAGSLPGEQTRASLALGDSWGLAVWQDNATDGDGLGISAIRLDGNYSPVLSSMRVNTLGAGYQENPAASLLSNGGAAVVWQGGPLGKPQIYARFMAANYTWTGSDILVNDLTGDFNNRPDIASRVNGSVIVTWSRYDESGQNGYDVYARRLDSVGGKIGTEFRVNTTTALHQQNSKVAVLSGGGASVIVWVSQGQRGPGSSDIYARKYSIGGTPQTGEILVNAGLNVCDNPSVTATEGGGFAVAWQEQTPAASSTDGLDILTRAFDSSGVGGQVHRVNGRVYGDQYAPRIATQGEDLFVVWTSLGQDGSFEGVYGRFLNDAGSPLGSEFRVNETTGGAQNYQTVASGASNRWVVAWSSYVGGGNTVDLRAQRYAPFLEPLLAPNPPFVQPAST